MNKKINCLIVDDEPLALDILEGFIETHPLLQLVGRCDNAFEAKEFLKHKEVDLLFLDINMPEISGIDLLKSLENPPMAIFTTAFQKYAIDGFDLNIVDYLLKPFSYERFHKAVAKVQVLMNSQILQEEKPETDDSYIFIKADQKLIKVLYSEILFIEALADYVKIHLAEKRIVTLQTMKNMEEKLPKERFSRVHRSYIVNIEKIQTIKGNDINVNEINIPIGKNYRDQFFERIRGMRMTA